MSIGHITDIFMNFRHTFSSKITPYQFDQEQEV